MSDLCCADALEPDFQSWRAVRDECLPDRVLALRAVTRDEAGISRTRVFSPGVVPVVQAEAPKRAPVISSSVVYNTTPRPAGLWTLAAKLSRPTVVD